MKGRTMHFVAIFQQPATVVANPEGSLKDMRRGENVISPRGILKFANSQHLLTLSRNDRVFLTIAEWPFACPITQRWFDSKLRKEKEHYMTTEVTMAQKNIHDKFESQIKSAAATLESVKARAEAAKADAEIKAIAALLPKKLALEQKLRELKTTATDNWQEAKADLQERIAEFEKSVKAIGSKART
jgi:hypothetical protein